MDLQVQPVSVMLSKLESWIVGFWSILPNVGIAIVVFLLLWGVAIVTGWAISSVLRRRGRRDLGRVAGSLVRLAMVIGAALIALTIVLPSLKPVDLVAGLGIGSVAIGFAFKDILQNLLAGILLLIRQPFRVGDQIIAKGHEGTVERIETRATLLRTYDGRRVVIPNSDIYTDAVVVNTAFPKRRSSHDIGIGYGDSIERAREVMMTAMTGVPGVETDPGPDVLVVELDSSAVVLRPRWWTNSTRADVVTVKSNVVEAIKLALDAAGIDMPYETVVQLFHDQTEETDGDRRKQREGWPKGKDPPRPARALRRTGYDAGQTGDAA